MSQAQQDPRMVGTPDLPSHTRHVVAVVLLIVGYVLAAPILVTMFDWEPSTVINDWLARPLHIVGFVVQPIWIMVGFAVAALACWIGAAIAGRRRTIGRGNQAQWVAMVRPLVTALTVVCALCVCFATPLLVLMHLAG